MRDPTTPSPRVAWLTLVVVAMGLFLAVVSTTVVSVALPTMGQNLRASPTDLQWVVDAYVVVYASLLIPGGALGDRYGRKGLFLLGVALFGIGSLITALAPSIGFVLLGRVIQGSGPALLVPGSLTIIRAVFADQRRRAAAIGLWSTSSGVALAVGPPLGGVLVAAAGWPTVFWVNVPLAVLLVALGGLVLPRLSPGSVRTPFDGQAVVLSSAAVALLALGVIEGQAHGWAEPWVLAAFAVGAAALLTFVLGELRRAHPLIDVRLFARPAFTAANVAAFVVFFAFVGVIVYFSVYFQQVQGLSAAAAGLNLTAIGVAYAVGATLSGRLVGAIGERWPLLIGLLVTGGATLGLLRLQPATGMAAVWWNFALLGAGSGLCGTPMSTLAMSAVEPARAGQASAVLNAARQAGQVFGVAVLGALVYAGLPAPTGGRLPPTQAAAFVTGLHHALFIAGISLVTTAALAAVLLSPRDMLSPRSSIS